MVLDKQRLLEERFHKGFYLRGAEEVAKDILGMKLVHETPEGITIGRIVETEAYLGEEDPASHAFEGKRTERTDILYKEGGKAYVYLIYGMYRCFNVVTEEKGMPQSVFIRALEPVGGLDLMKKRRGMEKNELELTNGPGKLSTAMGISLNHSGADLCKSGLLLSSYESKEDLEIVSDERINVDYAEEARNWPLRFYLKNNRYVSE